MIREFDVEGFAIMGMQDAEEATWGVYQKEFMKGKSGSLQTTDRVARRMILNAFGGDKQHEHAPLNRFEKNFDNDEATSG